MENEGKFQAICEFVNEAIVMVNSKCIVSFWNKAAEIMFGYSNQEIIGEKVYSLLVPQRFHDTFKKGFNKFRRTGKATTDGKTIELIGVKKDGTEFPVELSLSSTKIKGKWYAIATANDITLRKKTEWALSIKGYALASSINAIAIADLNGKLMYVNDSFLKIWKYGDKKELLGEHVSKFWEKEEKAFEILKILYEDGGWIGEMTAIKKDGSVFEVQLYTNIVKNKIGEPLCMMATFIDITERKHMEKALKESENKFRTVVEKTGDISYVMDINSIISYIGPQVERYGFRVEDIEDHNFIELIYPEDRKSTLEDFQMTIQSEIETITTFRVETPKMGIIFFEESGKILRDKEGDIIGLTGTLRDVTERKQAEEELKQKVRKARFLSFIDDLTGLYNRRGFFNFATQYLKLTRRTKRELLIIYIDVDQLKQINDTFGHNVGSLALIDTGNILKETFRASDIIARIGGDEFVVLAIEAVGTSIKSIAKRLQINLDSHNKKRGHPNNYKLSISMGITRYDPENPCSINELMDRADKLMYEQKNEKEKARKI